MKQILCIGLVFFMFFSQADAAKAKKKGEKVKPAGLSGLKLS